MNAYVDNFSNYKQSTRKEHDKSYQYSIRLILGSVYFNKRHGLNVKKISYKELLDFADGTFFYVFCEIHDRDDPCTYVLQEIGMRNTPYLLLTDEYSELHPELMNAANDINILPKITIEKKLPSYSYIDLKELFRETEMTDLYAKRSYIKCCLCDKTNDTLPLSFNPLHQIGNTLNLPDKLHIHYNNAPDKMRLSTTDSNITPKRSFNPQA